MVPPPTQVVQILRKIVQHKGPVRAYLSFPEWVGAAYWPVITDGEYFAPYIHGVYYAKPSYQTFNEATSIFSGYVHFRLITVFINTRFATSRVKLA